MHPPLRLCALAATAAAAILLTPGPADADSDACEVAHWHADQALTQVTIDLPARWTLVIECGTPTHAGYADPDAHTVTVWPETLGSVDAIAWMILHEYGHAYDHARLDDLDRDAWMAVRGLDEPWWQHHDTAPDHAAWTQIPAEDWASSVAYCVSGEAGWGWSDPAQAPTVEECGLVQWLTGLVTAA